MSVTDYINKNFGWDEPEGNVASGTGQPLNSFGGTVANTATGTLSLTKSLFNDDGNKLPEEYNYKDTWFGRIRENTGAEDMLGINHNKEIYEKRAHALGLDPEGNLTTVDFWSAHPNFNQNKYFEKVYDAEGDPSLLESVRDFFEPKDLREKRAKFYKNREQEKMLSDLIDNIVIYDAVNKDRHNAYLNYAPECQPRYQSRYRNIDINSIPLFTQDEEIKKPYSAYSGPQDAYAKNAIELFKPLYEDKLSSDRHRIKQEIENSYKEYRDARDQRKGIREQ